jgi:TRAP-type C4-dicarboxylate transport system substrate-binding protein
MKKNKIITAILIAFLSLSAQTSFAKILHKEQMVSQNFMRNKNLKQIAQGQSQNINIVFEDNTNNQFNIDEAKQLNTILNAEDNNFNILIKTNNLSQKNNLENLDLGGSDLLITNSNNYGNYTENKETNIFNLPFLFTNIQEIQKFINSNVYIQLIQKLSTQSNSMQVIGFIPSGKNILLSNFPITSLKNLQNKNMAVINGSLDGINYYKSLKAKPVDLNKDELNKIKEKNISILEIPITDVANQKDIKNMKFINTSTNRFDFKIVLMNKKAWNKLPINLQQKMIETVLNDANNHLNNLQAEQNSILKSLSDNNYKIENFNNEDIGNMKKAAIAIHNNYLQNVDKDLLLETYQLLKN